MIYSIWVTELSHVWEKVANSACQLFILWLLYCISLSFPLVLGLDLDQTVSVPALFIYFSK